MKKNIIAAVIGIVVAACFVVGGLNYIAYSHRLTPAEPLKHDEPSLSASSDNISDRKSSSTALNDFDKTLITFIEENGHKNENYMISPASFKAALALAVSGSDTETKEELLHAMGFSSMDEVIAWYNSIIESEDYFNESLKSLQKEFKANKPLFDFDEKAPEGSFKIENSIWRNTSAGGSFSKDYKKYVEKNFGAKAAEASPSQITGKVNDWINKETNGLIPKISDDLSEMDIILVNTLYLKTSWVNTFYEEATEEGDFTTFDGSVVKKDFMQKEDKFRYYEDENGKLVVLPMNGGINAVFILGDIDNVPEKVVNASKEEVSIKLPKFETESTFSNDDLIEYLKSVGVTHAFSENADFSVMSKDMNVYITDIIQKTRIKVDEDGLEAAAATMISMLETAIYIEEQDIKEFIADKPFKYMIMTNDEKPEVLFYGQVVE